MTDHTIIPRFEDPAFDPAYDLAGLDPETAAFVSAMHRDGGGVIDLGEAGRRLCDQAVAQTDSMFARGRRVQDAWRCSAAVRGLALFPKVHAALRAAYGREPFAFQTLNFQTGSEQELHTDVIHFSSEPYGFMCGVWIALEDITPGSGPLIWYPASHKVPPLGMREAGVNAAVPSEADYHRTWAPAFARRIAASGLPAESLILKKGQAFVWAANLAHGGAPITEPGSTRRSLVVHCYFEDSFYFTPRVSDLEAGRLAARLPPDIRTGRMRWPRREGRLAPVRLKTLVAAILRDLMNKPHVA